MVKYWIFRFLSNQVSKKNLIRFFLAFLVFLVIVAPSRIINIEEKAHKTESDKLLYAFLRGVFIMFLTIYRNDIIMALIELDGIIMITLCFIFFYLILAD